MLHKRSNAFDSELAAVGHARRNMPERNGNDAEYELQSLLGRGSGKSATAETATATVCSVVVHGMHPNIALQVRSHSAARTSTPAIICSQVSVTGMHCSSCSTAVERALRYAAFA